MRTVLPSIPIPSLTISVRRRPRQRFQIGDIVDYDFLGWEKFRVEAVKRYGFFRITWAVRYQIRWISCGGGLESGTTKNVGQWWLLHNQRAFNRAFGVKDAKVVKDKRRWGVETDGDWR